MTLRILGPPPLEQDENGQHRSRIATIFPKERTLITVPGIHATQRTLFLDELEKQREQDGEQRFTRLQESQIWRSAVDLIIQNGLILIRPSADNMPQCLEADVLLQELVSKRRIRFLEVHHENVHDSIKKNGECWRIAPMARSTDEMKEVIDSSRIAIDGDPIYYYNNRLGTRFLTCEAFEKLGGLTDDALLAHLREIQHYCDCINSLGNREVDFFFAGRQFREEILTHSFENIEPAACRGIHAMLTRKFADLVPMEMRKDDPDDTLWRGRMFAALTPQEEHFTPEETRLGLSPEFYMHIEWLPGGRVVNGELIFDSVLDEPGSSEDLLPHCDEKARSLIFNFIRDYDNIEYINVGRIIESLSTRRERKGRRGVYVVEMKQRGNPNEIVRIVRMQKWDTWERLDEGKELLQAMMDSEDYTEYILDRGMGCRRLGMNLCQRMSSGRVSEIYRGKTTKYHGTRVWTPYFERNYIRGMATDKIPNSRFKDPAFAIRFASLLGRAAASNMIVGRCTDSKRVLFDDGDEVLIEDGHRMPVDLIVTHYTGAFAEFERGLCEYAGAYALPINSRVPHVVNPAAFVESYVSAFRSRFDEIQQSYREQRRALDTLFHHRRKGETGSLAFRWERILERLDQTDTNALEKELRAHLPRE